MLSPDDQRLVMLDSHLPGLRKLLDDEAMTVALAKAWPSLGVRRVAANYVRYKPRTSCIVGYEITTDTEKLFTYGRAHRAASSEKLRVDRDEAVLLPEWSSIVFRPGYDAELPGLRRLTAENDEGLFAKLTGRARRAEERVESLAYKPERRWVGRVGGAASPEGVIKCYAPGDFAQVRAHAKRFRSTGSLCVPKRLGKSGRFAALFTEWLDGRALCGSERLSAEDLGRIGCALRHLHAQSPDRLAVIGAPTLASRVTATRELIGAIAPQHEHRASQLAERLCGNLTDPQRIVSLHGDFYANQVLMLADGRIGLIDLDEAAAGEAAIDLGNFLAHGIAAGAIETRHDIDAMADALLVGYGDQVPALFVQAAISAFQLCTRPFRHRASAWGEMIGRMLDVSEQLLQRHRRPCRNDVEDPFDARSDSKLGPFLQVALDADQVEPMIRPLIDGSARLRRIRVRRLKPQRRCLIEYEFDAFTLIGKVRGKGVDERGFRALESAYDSGFRGDSADGISVPRPIGMIPSLAMTLQAKVLGTPATELLVGADGIALSRRIAQALVKLHRSGVVPTRTHTIDDEMSILRQRLADAAAARPELARRIEALRIACEEVASSLPLPAQLIGTHRDFYADQVLVASDRLYLLDFDLFCLGDPALDAGNFIAHLTELALRTLNNAIALAAHERAFEDEFCALHGRDMHNSIRGYATLTLARHVWISHNIAQRRPWTQQILALCERRCGLASPRAVG